MDSDVSFGRGGLNPYLDVDELVEDIGLDEDEIARRKEFIGFDREDERRLSDLEELLRENRTAIADDFYENLLQYEETREIIDRSPKGVDALKRTQQAYLVSLATGDYDRAYFENRARIGKLHELLDMPLKHYVGQYGVYYDLIMSRLNERVQDQVVAAIEEWAADRETERDDGLDRLVGALGLGESERDDGGGLDESFEETIREAIDDGMMDVLALLRILNLDLQVATDTYLDSYAQRLEDSIERRERLARDVEADVQEPIDELREASAVVAQRAETISTHAATQAASIDRAASEVGEASAAIDAVASIADEVHAESQRTERLAADGVDAADEALAELETIETAVDDVSSAVSSLEDRTDEIDGIVDRLDDLAKRTSMLAKNARIEASRDPSGSEATSALEVIANEVGSFAEQTQSDLRAIEDTVESVRADAAATIETADETVARVDTGTERIRDTVDSLEAIHESARSTATGMDDVAAATDQQARSVESIADSIAELSETADQVAGAAESVAAASQEQTASLQDVGESVDRLTSDDDPDRTPVYEKVQ
ncbi:globin-coupled sensor protein [Halosolutus halophilus]|uniref:globin-coupled sensor protein n=1 Tax=Halosolutus halophilus TaxID=1552990 RepID=UPI002234F602|nr:globin-coupled sensor protein [Halosolutus halophilus]